MPRDDHEHLLVSAKRPNLSVSDPLPPLPLGRGSADGGRGRPPAPPAVNETSIIPDLALLNSTFTGGYAVGRVAEADDLTLPEAQEIRRRTRRYPAALWALVTLEAEFARKVDRHAVDWPRMADGTTIVAFLRAAIREARGA